MLSDFGYFFEPKITHNFRGLAQGIVILNVENTVLLAPRTDALYIYFL